MTSAVCRLKALRGKPKAKHIESELLSAVVRTHHPRVVEAQLGERGRNTDELLKRLGDRALWNQTGG